MSYDPFKDPVPRTKPRASGKLWEQFKGHDIYACELKYHGEFGLEAQNFEAGWLLVGRRFGGFERRDDVSGRSDGPISERSVSVRIGAAD